MYRHSLRVLSLTTVLLWATAAGAQTTPAMASSQAPASSTDNSPRPATTTFFGDTGLWFVPTAEVVPHGTVSVSGYRRGTNYLQGFTNVGDFAGTFAFGVRDRAEIFGSFLFDTRIDRDLRPIFISDATVGGVLDRYPHVTKGWSGDNIGDFYLGAKISLWSQYRQNPAAIALRLMSKLPTGKKDAGVSTGKADFSVDFVVSKEANEKVDVSAFAGYEMRGKPAGFDAPGGALRWGAGAGFPSRSPLRAALEIHGLMPNDDVITGPRVVGFDGSLSPVSSNVQKLTYATAALTWQSKGGFFIGGGLSWNLPRKSRAAFRTDDEATDFNDYADWQIRIGYHPGVRYYIPPPPPPPPPPANRPPTVTARCEPCSVLVGQRSTVTADAQDPDGDPLTYRWSAPSGTFQNPADRQTVWTAPQQAGAVPATVTVDDGRGGTASASVTIQVTAPPPVVVELTFEDVHFDFDRSTLRPEALRLLDEAVTKLQANPTKNIILEGHTCNIGTAEYNLALGERRASSVREYLTSHGVAANRLETRSYGEERPKHDNAREETRRLNRRAALVVRVQ